MSKSETEESCLRDLFYSPRPSRQYRNQTDLSKEGTEGNKKIVDTIGKSKKLIPMSLCKDITPESCQRSPKNESTASNGLLKIDSLPTLESQEGLQKYYFSKMKKEKKSLEMKSHTLMTSKLMQATVTQLQSSARTIKQEVEKGVDPFAEANTAYSRREEPWKAIERGGSPHLLGNLVPPGSFLGERDQ